MDRSIAPVNATGRLKPALAGVNMSRWRSAALGEAGRVGTAAAVLAGRIATDIRGYRAGICRVGSSVDYFREGQATPVAVRSATSMGGLTSLASAGHRVIIAW